MTKKYLVTSVFVPVLLLGIYGCNSPQSTAPPAAVEPAHDDHEHSAHTESDHDHDGHEHAEHDKSAEKTDMEKMTEELASFSAEDRESAMKQHFCPVSGQMLGSMGAPEKIDVNGQSVWICCDGCKDKLLADPDTYLAKLAK